MHISRSTILMLSLMLIGCSRAPLVTIENHSAFTLSNVVVSGSGFTQPVGSIVPGSEHKLSVHPTGESGLRVAFDSEGRHIDSGEQGYFEGDGGYRVTATVGTNLSVSITSDFK